MTKTVLKCRSSFDLPFVYHDYFISFLTREVNGILGKKLINHLIKIDPNNRWMLKYHKVGSAHAIAQLQSLIKEIYERGTNKAIYGDNLNTEAFLFLLSRRFPFSTFIRLNSGFMHSIICVGLEGTDIICHTSINNKENFSTDPQRIFSFKIDISKFLNIWISSGSNINFMVLNIKPEIEFFKLFGLKPVSESINWKDFDKYLSELRDYREAEQFHRRTEFLRRRRLNIIYEEIGELEFVQDENAQSSFGIEKEILKITKVDNLEEVEVMLRKYV